ncbi:MAG: transglutaminase-like domain-containing protein [candidate division NC10 bacterium]|nr:transglutaminase-like domain-containing protein [candidate division NC10 bacterium]
MKTTGATEARVESYRLQDRVSIEEVPAGARQLEVWVPFLQSDEHQRVLGVKVEADVPLTLQYDREWGNGILHGRLSPARKVELHISYQVLRWPARVALDPTRAQPLDGMPEAFLRSLLPERYVRVDAEMRERAVHIVGREKNPLKQAEALYDHVVGFMKYDATQQSWKGSTDHALTCQIGNCNDIHALYISLCRAIQIPARLVMGFALEAPSPEQCEVCGYHCWAETYVGGLGWIPVDASCACKYGHAGFGTLDLNHIAYSRGRDLLLEPPQRGERLLYFPAAYAEMDGTRHKHVERHLTFEALERH